LFVNVYTIDDEKIDENTREAICSFFIYLILKVELRPFQMSELRVVTIGVFKLKNGVN